MYIYEMPPVDDFLPFTAVHELIYKMKTANEMTGHPVEDVSRIHRIVADAKTYFRLFTTWEGDGEEYMIPFPTERGITHYAVMIKQENNGTTYISSMMRLQYLDEYLVKTTNNKRQYTLQV